MTLKKMNERSPQETRKVVEKQKGRITTTKLREQQPCQPPKYPSTLPRKERIPITSFHPGLRDPSPQKPDTPPQEGQAKGGLPITKETCHKDGKGLPPSKNKPPFFQKVKQKEEEPASPKHFLFIQGSPITQVALNRWYKNDRSPRNTHLDITTPKRNISLETS